MEEQTQTEQQKADTSYIICKHCNSYRIEILYYDRRNISLVCRCFGCGNISDLFLQDELPVDKQESNKGNVQLKSRGYLG